MFFAKCLPLDTVLKRSTSRSVLASITSGSQFRSFMSPVCFIVQWKLWGFFGFSLGFGFSFKPSEITNLTSVINPKLHC